MIAITFFVTYMGGGGVVCDVLGFVMNVDRAASIATRVVPKRHRRGGNRDDDQCDYESNHEKIYGGSTNWRVKEYFELTPLLFQMAPA